MASTTYLTRTPSSAGNRKTFTFSAWIKGQTRNPAGTTGGTLFSCGTDTGSGPLFIIDFLNGQNIRVEDTITGGSQPIDIRTNRVFRDVNAWYHIVIAVDTTQGTASDRVKIYVNGVQETSLSATTYPGQNIDTSVNNTHVHIIGGRAAGLTNKYFDGSMSHIHFVDGTAYPASTFGSTDATTGEWKINTSPSVTYGTNGFWILKDGNSVTDQSGNSNNFTVAGGTLTKTEDNPSNVFCTWNPLNYDFANNPSTFAKGNTQVTPTQTTAYNTGVSTLAMPKGNGKFYTEIKYISSGNVNGGFGIVDMDYVNKIYYENYNLMEETTATTIGRVIYGKNGAVVTGGGVETGGFGGTWSNGDIIGIACDMENGAIYFSKNGTWQNSGDPTSGVSRTGAVNTSAASWWTGTSQWGLWCGKKVSTTDLSFQANFGNGYFNTTAVSSAGTNASNNGIFEYDVPSGYTALSTKGLNL